MQLNRVATGAVLIGAGVVGLSLWTAAFGASGVGRITGHVSVTNAGALAPDAAGVVVYLVGFTSPAPAAHAAMVQKGHQFVPELLPVVVGQVVDFPNVDWDTSHNVFSNDPRFNLGQYRAGRGPAPTMTFAEPGPVEVFCDIHPDMAATVLALPNAAFATTASDGTFVIEGVPAGSWDLFAYDRRSTVPTRAHVVVEEGGTSVVDVAVDRTRFDFDHKSWDGTDYGDRYQPPAKAP
jgi:plastocyanin